MIILLLGLVAAGPLAAQLRVGEWTPEPAPLTKYGLLYRPRLTVNPAPAARPPAFDFTATRPHLAFFCRLEINEAAGGVIPLKFRLGGHSAWQDRIPRRGD